MLSQFLAQAQGQISPPDVSYAAIAPVLIILGAACLSVLIEAFVAKESRWAWQVALCVLAIVAAGLSLILFTTSDAAKGGVAGHTGVLTLANVISIDQPALFLWGTLLALGLLALLLLADKTVDRDGALQTEVFPLFLFALGGMLVFSAANNLLTMFIALEVLSLPLYLMCGLARKRQLISQEAAVKYFLLGAFASAFFLYGLALLYGYAGSVRLSDIANAAVGTNRSDALLFGGLGLLVVGLLFKAAVGPFHTWTPDVYQGAPTPVTAFMAACTKVAAFGGILRVLTVSFQSTQWEWRGVLWAVCIVSMAIGAIFGLTQTDVKRMIAYSSVAHAGFLLVGAISLNTNGLQSTLFYLVAYGFTTIAAFGVVTLVRRGNGEASNLSEWAGLAKRSPLLAAVFTFLLLALAGIPLTSGFVGKFVVFSAALQDGMAPLVVIALIFSAVAAFFYLRVVVLMYFSEPAPDGPTVTVPGAFTSVAIGLGVFITLLLGVVPGFVLDWAKGGFLG